MTSNASNNNKKFKETEEALADASKLLSRLCKSRKAGMRLQEIIDLTGKVASLSRSLQKHGTDSDDNNGYGDPNHHAKISEPSRCVSVIR